MPSREVWERQLGEFQIPPMGYIDAFWYWRGELGHPMSSSCQLFRRPRGKRLHCMSASSPPMRSRFQDKYS